MMEFPVMNMNEMHWALCWWIRITGWRGTHEYRNVLVTGKSIGLYSITVRIDEHWQNHLNHVLDEVLK